MAERQSAWVAYELAADSYVAADGQGLGMRSITKRIVN